MDTWQVGVFLSSLGFADPVDAVKKAEELGLMIAQLPPLGDDFLTGPGRDRLLQAISDAGIHITAGCAGFSGEDYSNMATVTTTVGYTNPDTLEERMDVTAKHASLAKDAGAMLLTTHVGVVPEDKGDPAWQRTVDAARRAADDCGEKGLLFGLETGQETAEVMLEYIDAVNRENLRINFDPANMILYGTGDPIPTLVELKDLVVHIHCKDGIYPKGAGELGTEVPLGQGEVGIERYLKTLKEIGYVGPLVIEREAGDDRIGDITRGRDLLEDLKKSILG